MIAKLLAGSMLAAGLSVSPITLQTASGPSAWSCAVLDLQAPPLEMGM